jgi:hypothetical protein
MYVCVPSSPFTRSVVDSPPLRVVCTNQQEGLEAALLGAIGLCTGFVTALAEPVFGVSKRKNRQYGSYGLSIGALGP